MTHKVFSKYQLLTQPNGSIQGLDSVVVFGENPELQAGVTEDVWDVGGIWRAPTAARTHDVSSSSGDDAAAGSGARVCRVDGLDASFNEQTEDVVLDGLTPVPTTKQFSRINSMAIPPGGFGASGLNAGDITAQAQVDATPSARIRAALGRSLSAIYTVPAGKTGYLTTVGGSVNKTAAGPPAECLLDLYARFNADQPDAGWTTLWLYGVVHGGTSVVGTDITPTAAIPGKTDLRMCALDVTGTDLDTSAWFGLILVDDDA